MAHPGKGQHEHIFNVIRSALIGAFHKFNCFGNAGVVADGGHLFAFITQQLDQNGRIERPFVVGDMAIWADDEITVVIEIGVFNNIEKWSKIQPERPIIHVGFDWGVTPINCQSAWSQTILKIIKAIAKTRGVLQ